ncbi:MAG: 6-bladed beta-propeller [Tannerella sp.]|nr:6-bladed beta-propeller [Tannerella sp.]
MPIIIRKKRNILLLLSAIVCLSCTQRSETEKHQKNRDNIINVHDRVIEIEMEDVLIDEYATLYLISDYLIICDYESHDKMVHLFDKKNFKYITSTANKGQGPGEIANIGHIEANEAERLFYVTDHGKQRIFSYNLDSVLVNPDYMPEVKMKMNERQFPAKYQYINDTLSYGLIIEPIGNSDFRPTVGQWNMQTGEISLMKYTHPEIEKKRITFAVSVDNGIYVECYCHHDLMSICTLDGNLKYNIYGEKWDNQKSNKYMYYDNVAFCKDKILALYAPGINNFAKKPNGEIKGNNSTQFIIFDLNGDYIQTIETGYKISRFCYDEDNNRIILSMDDDIQFGYFDLAGIIE